MRGKSFILDLKQGVLGRSAGITASLCFILGTFCIDFTTAPGYTIWMFYMLALVSAMRWAKPVQIWALATVCVGLMTIDLYYSPHDAISDEYFGRIINSRFLSANVLLVVAALCARQIRTAAGLRLLLEEEREAHNRIHTLMETSGDGFLILDEAGLIQMNNETLRQMFGYDHGELIGRNVAILVPAADRPRLAELRKSYVEGPEAWRPGVGRKLRAERKSGAEFSTEITVNPMRIKGKALVIASVRDLTEKQDFESIIVRQNRRLNALRQIDIAITGSLDMRLTALTVLEHVRTELSVDSAVLLHHNRHDMTLDYVAAAGFRTTALQHTHLRVGEGYAGLAAQARKKMFISDLRRTTGTLFTQSHHVDGEGFVSYMAVPLISKGRLEGVLELFHRSVLEINDEWEEFLDALAGQTAIAIDNADLYSDLDQVNSELRQAYDRTLEGWVHALDIRDDETEGHSRRVTEMTVKLARSAGISGDALTHVRRGALLHDIGKLGIPDSILFKAGKLNDQEWAIMKRHPVYAFEWLTPIDYLRYSIDVPYCHHEKWDGSGYPRGLKGEVIPLAARLFAVVDVWDALCSDRPYRKAWPPGRVLDHIMSLAGTHFDPGAVEAFLRLEGVENREVG